MNFLESFSTITAAVQLFPNMASFANTYCFRMALSGTVSAIRPLDPTQDYRILDTAKNAIHAISTSVNEMRERFYATPSIFGHFIDIFSEEEDIPAPTPLTNPWDTSFRFVTKHRHLIEDPMNAWLEKFVKLDIHEGIPVGGIVKVPLKVGTACYRMHQKISKDGLVAYAFTPVIKGKHLVPLITFRCTELNPFKEEALNSVYNDLDTHIGQRGWESTKKEFEELMQDPLFRGSDEKIQVAGYSLGGAQAQYFIEEHFQKVSHAIFYNSPSINPETVDSFAEKAAQIPAKNPMVLQIFRTVGDPIDRFGEKHLGCGVDHPGVRVQLLEVHYPKVKSFSPFLHNRHIFSSRFDYIVHECDDPEQLISLLDNGKRDHFSAYGELIRREVSKVLKSLITGMNFCATVVTTLLQKLKLHNGSASKPPVL